MHTATRSSKSSDEEVAALRRASAPRGRRGSGLERVEADLRVVVEGERVGLDRAGQRIDAGDRLRVDRVAEVGPGRLAAGDHRVGEGLQRAVGQVGLGEGRLRRHESARDRSGVRHEGGEPQNAAARKQPAPRQIGHERVVLRVDASHSNER